MEPAVKKIMAGGSGVFIVTGDKGAGKTHFMVWWADVLVGLADHLPPPHSPQDWHVISNIVFGKYKGTRANQPQDDPESILEFDRVLSPHPRFHFANTRVDAERLSSELILEAWKRGRRVHILHILDEGPIIGLGGKATQTSVYDERSMSLYKSITLSRKVGSALMIAALRTELLSPKLRESEDIGGIGLVSAVFSKWPEEIEAIARRSLEDDEYDYAYDIKGVPYRQLVAVKPRSETDFVPSILLVGETLHARDLRKIRVGDVIYDTFSIAGFTLGELNGKPFVLDDLIFKLSDKHSSEIPELYYAYFHPASPQFTPKQEEAIEDDAEGVGPGELEAIERHLNEGMAERDVDDTKSLLALQKAVAEDRAAFNRYGTLKYPHWSELYRAAGVSESTFYRLKDELDLFYRTEADDKEGSGGTT